MAEARPSWGPASGTRGDQGESALAEQTGRGTRPLYRHLEQSAWQAGLRYNLDVDGEVALSAEMMRP